MLKIFEQLFLQQRNGLICVFSPILLLPGLRKHAAAAPWILFFGCGAVYAIIAFFKRLQQNAIGIFCTFWTFSAVASCHLFTKKNTYDPSKWNSLNLNTSNSVNNFLSSYKKTTTIESLFCNEKTKAVLWLYCNQI